MNRPCGQILVEEEASSFMHTYLCFLISDSWFRFTPLLPCTIPSPIRLPCAHVYRWALASRFALNTYLPFANRVLLHFARLTLRASVRLPCVSGSTLSLATHACRRSCVSFARFAARASILRCSLQNARLALCRRALYFAHRFGMASVLHYGSLYRATTHFALYLLIYLLSPHLLFSLHIAPHILACAPSPLPRDIFSLSKHLWHFCRFGTPFLRLLSPFLLNRNTGGRCRTTLIFYPIATYFAVLRFSTRMLYIAYLYLTARHYNNALPYTKRTSLLTCVPSFGWLFPYFYICLHARALLPPFSHWSRFTLPACRHFAWVPAHHRHAAFTAAHAPAVLPPLTLPSRLALTIFILYVPFHAAFKAF